MAEGWTKVAEDTNGWTRAQAKPDRVAATGSILEGLKDSTYRAMASLGPDKNESWADYAKSLGPAGKLAKGVYETSKDQASKAKDAYDRGSKLEALGHAVGVFPGLPQIAAVVGETAGGQEPKSDKYGNVTESGKEADPWRAVGQIIPALLGASRNNAKSGARIAAESEFGKRTIATAERARQAASEVNEVYPNAGGSLVNATLGTAAGIPLGLAASAGYVPAFTGGGAAMLGAVVVRELRRMGIKDPKAVARIAASKLPPVEVPSSADNPPMATGSHVPVRPPLRGKAVPYAEAPPTAGVNVPLRPPLSSQIADPLAKPVAVPYDNPPTATGFQVPVQPPTPPGLTVQNSASAAVPPPEFGQTGSGIPVKPPIANQGTTYTPSIPVQKAPPLPDNRGVGAPLRPPLVGQAVPYAEAPPTAGVSVPLRPPVPGKIAAPLAKPVAVPYDNPPMATGFQVPVQPPTPPGFTVQNSASAAVPPPEFGQTGSGIPVKLPSPPLGGQAAFDFRKASVPAEAPVQPVSSVTDSIANSRRDYKTNGLADIFKELGVSEHDLHNLPDSVWQQATDALNQRRANLPPEASPGYQHALPSDQAKALTEYKLKFQNNSTSLKDALEGEFNNRKTAKVKAALETLEENSMGNADGPPYVEKNPGNAKYPGVAKPTDSTSQYLNYQERGSREKTKAMRAWAKAKDKKNQ